jgi:hypothetical protein
MFVDLAVIWHINNAPPETKPPDQWRQHQRQTQGTCKNENQCFNGLSPQKVNQL